MVITRGTFRAEISRNYVLLPGRTMDSAVRYAWACFEENLQMDRTDCFGCALTSCEEAGLIREKRKIPVRRPEPPEQPLFRQSVEDYLGLYEADLARGDK